jgi:hypothetical protein
VRETSTRYARPHRPMPVRLFNGALGLAGRLGGRVALDPASLMNAAEEATGLLDFGEPSFREPLERLVDSIEKEASLHALGRLITRTRLVSALSTRARIEEQYRRHPEIEEESVSRPIVIAGLQRTGTTLLHRLLASDRRIRSLASWEALSPAPLSGGAIGGSSDPRRARAEQSEKALSYLAPDFFAIHPVEANAPEEDVLLLDLSFRSTVPEATLRVPTFSRWLESADQAPAYETLVRAMKLLSHQRRGSRWVLKTPHHLEWLDVLLSVLPDALIVWTHREPRETVPSFCSMVAHGRGVFSDAVDPREVGQHWSRKITRMVERGMAAREAAGERYFIDVRYEDLVRDPLGETRRIYAKAELPFERETEDAMKDTLKKQRQHRHGVHVYRAEDFGLTNAGLDRDLATYRERFLK